VEVNSVDAGCPYLNIECVPSLNDCASTVEMQSSVFREIALPNAGQALSINGHKKLKLYINMLELSDHYLNVQKLNQPVNFSPFRR